MNQLTAPLMSVSVCPMWYFLSTFSPSAVARFLLYFSLFVIRLLWSIVAQLKVCIMRTSVLPTSSSSSCFFKKLYFILSCMVWLFSALTALDSVGLHSIKPIHKSGIEICGAQLTVLTTRNRMGTKNDDQIFKCDIKCLLKRGWWTGTWILCTLASCYYELRMTFVYHTRKVYM